MKQNFTFLAVGLFLYTASFSQNSKVFDNLSMPSKILGMERKFAIYLPPGYDDYERSYPVLYLLHGGSDNQTAWIQFGEVQYIADKAFRDGIATPMIIVMPDADTGQRGYTNDASGKWRYEDFSLKNLYPILKNRTASERINDTGQLQAFQWVAVALFTTHCIVPTCFLQPAR